MRTERSDLVDDRQGADGRRIVAATLGACVGISGVEHGFFELLQGNTRTPGFLIQAIGPSMRMWEYGTEEAITLVPNFLVTGILAMILGVLTIWWSVTSLDRPNGSRSLLVLGSVTMLVGGGIGMVVFLVFGWAVAARIGRPPRRPSILPGGVRRWMGRVRPVLVGLSLLMYLAAVGIAITGFVPGIAGPDRAFAVCWGLLSASLAGFALALIGSSDGDERIRAMGSDSSSVPVTVRS